MQMETMVRFNLLFLLFIAIFISANAQEKKSIFILHSYSQEYSWTKRQHDNFVEKLQTSSQSALDIYVEYLDTKRLLISPEYETFFRSYLEEKFKGVSPDAIYVTDDNALNFFLHQKAPLFADSPIFFSGINNLSLEVQRDKSRYSGVYETKDIVPNIELIRQFSPQTRDIWIVGDDSTTYHSIEADIRAHIHKYPKYTFHFLSSKQIKDITSSLPYFPKTFVLLTTIGGWSDEKGNNLTLKESIAILKQNKHLILCSMEDAYVQGGVVGGFVTSGANQGMRAAELVLRYFNGEPIAHIASITRSPNVYMFDRKALMESRLILSEYIAHDSVILHEKKTFFERYQHNIMNAIFILFVFFLLFLLIVFLISLQKNAYIKRLEKELQECSDAIEHQNNKLMAIEGVDE